MSIKNAVYALQQHFKTLATPPTKQAHIYELIAATFGFNSYASLKSVGILTQHRAVTPNNSALIDIRSIELGYTAFPTDDFVNNLESQAIGVIQFKELVKTLGDGDSLNDDEIEQLSNLETNPWANYCLALHYLENGDDEPIGSEYWYQQMQAGRLLSDIEKDWALAYKAELNKVDKYESYLRKAASLGSEMAMLDLAEKNNDASIFDSNHQFESANSVRVAEVAESLGRFKEHHYWLTVAAETGNIQAMADLIDTYDSNNLGKCWTWVYLSNLLGEDLRNHHHVAIHENGSEYDDDVGGPIFVSGTDGVDLDPLSKDQDGIAKLMADTLFERIKNA